MRKILLPVVVAALASGGAVTAWAHAYLVRSTPGADAVLPTSPGEIRLWFTEAIEPAVSTIELRDLKGAPVGHEATVAGDGNKSLAVTLTALAPGKYTVVWSIVAVDTHASRGAFAFTVKP
jgi:methionine-rich copper-binding protein CopC